MFFGQAVGQTTPEFSQADCGAFLIRADLRGFALLKPNISALDDPSENQRIHLLNRILTFQSVRNYYQIRMSRQKQTIRAGHLKLPF